MYEDEYGEKQNKIIAYLQSKGLNPRRTGDGTNAECNCPYCGKEGHLYIVIEEHEKGGRKRLPGFHDCKKCGERGGLSKIKRKLGDIPNLWQVGDNQSEKVGENNYLKASKNDPIRPPNVVPEEGVDLKFHENLKRAYEGKSECEYEKKALAWLIDERGIPWEILETFRIGFTWLMFGKRNRQRVPFISYPCYSIMGSLINFKFRAVAGEDFGVKPKTFMKWPGCESHPYGIETLQEEHPAVIIIEGEQDFLAMQAMGYRNVVSLPDGANSWDHKWTRYFANFERVFIALDNDAVGQDAAPKIADRLGKLRCENVLFPLKDPNDCLMAGILREEIDLCFEKAEAFPGSQIIDISDHEEQLIARLKGGAKTTGIPTGYENLDPLVAGWREGELTILTGDTGMGKTTKFLSWAEKLAGNDCNTVYCPFEMPPIALMTKLVAIKAGRSFLQLDEATVRKTIKEIREKIPLYFLDAYGQMGLDPIIELVSYAAKYLGIGAFFLDPLQYALQESGGNGERQELIQATRKLQKLAKTLAIRIFMIVHPAKLPPDRKKSRKVELDDLPGSASLKQDADNILRLWAKPYATGALSPYVEVTALKIRSEFGRLGTAKYMFDPDALIYKPFYGDEPRGPAYGDRS